MLNKLESNELEILQALADAGGVSNWLTSSSIAKEARNKGATLNAPTIYRVLSRLREEVEYRTKDGVRRFHIKRNGYNLLNINGPAGARFVMPGTPWSTQRELKTFLKENSSGFLFLVDPYISEETLDVISDVHVPIQILACQIGRKGKEEDFARCYKNFKREKKGSVELRQIAQTELHGRYLFTGTQGWVIDHSIQDLGTKPALVIPLHLEKIFSQVKSHFANLFSKANLVQ
ncbi:MAG TPA: hypothetical protein PLB51_02800 [Candidatus Paceibacterota bacterium]|nr:hypothetical protein [Candidatus Paceibacterota bacterium]